MTVPLSSLAGDLAIEPPGADPEVSGISEDSRRIQPGMVFVAVPGSALDGHAYISDAVARGAVAVVAERTGAIPPGVPSIRTPSARATLADLAARFYGRPADGLRLIGFTGTFGKTSTSELLRSLLEAAGRPTGLLGSLGARYGRFAAPSGGLTTPAPVELHARLAALGDAGARTVIMEVTSHALRMRRVEGLRFDGGLLAAIMPGEHTDFHRTYEDYVEAKRLFLTYLAPGATLAFDADNRAARDLARDARVAGTVGFSLSGRDADLQLWDVLIDGRGCTFTIGGPAAAAAAGTRIHTPLLGRGHLHNVALALTYALADGVTARTARDVLGDATPLERRMERYDVLGRTVLDDTAGHPRSLQAALDVASMLHHRHAAVVYALRGSRGADINRRNALALADLTALHGFGTLIVTAASDAAGPSDVVTPAETDATKQALVEKGCRFVWHDGLAAAVQEALERTVAGDLIVLLGAQGMNQGRRMIEAAS